jgi:hypothetical protein
MDVHSKADAQSRVDQVRAFQSLGKFLLLIQAAILIAISYSV